MDTGDLRSGQLIGGRFETFYRDDIVHMVLGRRLIVCAWRDAPSMTQVKALRRINVDARRRLGDDGVAYCNVVISGTPVFASEVRDEITAISRDFGKRGVAQAHLILMEGFAGTAVRAFLSTVNLIARPSVPNKVSGDRREVEEWLLEKMFTVDRRVTEDWVSPAFDQVLQEARAAE